MKIRKLYTMASKMFDVSKKTKTEVSKLKLQWTPPPVVKEEHLLVDHSEKIPKEYVHGPVHGTRLDSECPNGIPISKQIQDGQFSKSNADLFFSGSHEIAFDYSKDENPENQVIIEVALPPHVPVKTCEDTGHLFVNGIHDVLVKKAYRVNPDYVNYKRISVFTKAVEIGKAIVNVVKTEFSVDNLNDLKGLKQ